MTEISAPIHADRPVVEQWLAARGVDPALTPPAYSPVLSEQSFPPGDDELRMLFDEGVPVCWLGGPAIGGEGFDWPVNSAGTPLAHVASIGLESLAGTVDADGKRAWGGGARVLDLLPESGNLEIFHDLTSFGYDPDGEPSGAWLVRWVPDAAGRPLVAGPGGGVADVDPRPTEVCQQVLPVPGWSIPTWEDAEPVLGAEAFDAYEAVLLDLQQSWHAQRFGEPAEYPVPYHHVYGHPSHTRGVADELLARHLPVASDDAHVLVAEFESWTALTGWFGDAGSLEVWMRASDLAARRFDAAWCLIRIDEITSS